MIGQIVTVKIDPYPLAPEKWEFLTLVVALDGTKMTDGSTHYRYRGSPVYCPREDRWWDQKCNFYFDHKDVKHRHRIATERYDRYGQHLKGKNLLNFFRTQQYEYEQVFGEKED